MLNQADGGTETPARFRCDEFIPLVPGNVHHSNVGRIVLSSVACADDGRGFVRPSFARWWCPSPHVLPRYASPVRSVASPLHRRRIPRFVLSPARASPAATLRQDRASSPAPSFGVLAMLSLESPHDPIWASRTTGRRSSVHFHHFGTDRSIDRVS